MAAGWPTLEARLVCAVQGLGNSDCVVRQRDQTCAETTPRGLCDPVVPGAPKMRSGVLECVGLSLRMLLHGGEPRRWPSRRQLVRGFRNLCRVLGAAALFMPPSEGQEPRALTVAAQAIEGRKCAETAKVHSDLRIVYNLAYGVFADEAGRFPVTGNYTTNQSKGLRAIAGPSFFPAFRW